MVAYFVKIYRSLIKSDRRHFGCARRSFSLSFPYETRYSRRTYDSRRDSLQLFVVSLFSSITVLKVRVKITNNSMYAKPGFNHILSKLDSWSALTSCYSSQRCRRNLVQASLGTCQQFRPFQWCVTS